MITMRLLARALTAVDRLAPPRLAHAHCDVPCGVYDPAQARIEAESVVQICEKYQESNDQEFRQRCILVKEERAELVKHHLMVLWADFFKPEHLEQIPELHEKFWNAIKAASDAKHSTDPTVARKCAKAVDQISDIFWSADGAEEAGLYREGAMAKS